jgi:hypothetical protein
MTLSALQRATIVLLTWPAWVALGQSEPPRVDAFLDAGSFNKRQAEEAQAEIAAAWHDGYAAMLIDLLDLVQRTRDVNPRTFMPPARLAEFLEQQTGQAFGEDVARWHEWAWSLPYAPHPNYGEFKGRLYAQLDPRFVVFFRAQVEPRIRLDEIVWGGVSINGIPPLDHPKHVPAAEATYLEDDNIVFGFYLGGEARAYPKRILAWHELALDRVGGRDLAIVYCTLCGTVIPFDARVGGRVLTFGTSGLLYRSNKLLFDHETASLWSSLTGEPVVGPVVELKVKMSALPVVTTSWREWRTRHPETLVLSLDTGFERDYSEGAAYRAYFATDELMFGVSQRDARLPNKAEVFVVRATSPPDAIPTARADTPPLAISTRVLSERTVFHTDVGGTPIVVITSPAGASRAYASQAYRFTATDGGEKVQDDQGRQWVVEEDFLVADFDSAVRLPRIVGHRAFWFGWYAQHPDTVLID